ncbi:MAG: tRNA uridine-5-carboxymethylaminomethyl(34) synthesis GTPase MnmE, partial [Methanobacteriota archaeon]
MLRAARLLPLSAAVRHASSLSAGAGDTIFAVATPPGRAALAIVRVSGSAVPSHLLPHLAPLVKPREASLRTIRHSVTSEPLDRGIVLYFPAPHSATGEHVVELHVHGGRAVVAAVCDSLAAIPGVRPAHAGEFTRRAFLNGRMDLTAVEGLADLLNADTQAQRRQALLQSDGELGALYDSWRARLLRALAHVEANIDFAEDEDDCRDHVYVAAEATVAALAAEMRAHLNDAHRGEIIREGVAVSLLGPPNAGKSSLFNALAKRPAAIVSHIPGTTRDVLELQLDIGGLPITLRDTAGVRTDTADDIERVGVERALASARASP